MWGIQIFDWMAHGSCTWYDGDGGDGTFFYDVEYENVDFEGGYEHATHNEFWAFPASSWPEVAEGESELNSFMEWDFVGHPYNSSTSTITFPYPAQTVLEHCNVQLPVGISSGWPVRWAGSWFSYSTATKGKYQRQAEATMELQTGGRASSQRSSLFCLSGTADKLITKYDYPEVNDQQTVYWTSGRDPATTPIPAQGITIDGLPLGNDGKRWRVYKDNDTRDVTPRVKGEDFYTFTISQQKYRLLIQANSSILQADRVVSSAKHLIGERIDLIPVFSPNLPEEPQKSNIKWSLSGQFINSFVLWILDVNNAPVPHFDSEALYNSAQGMTDFKVDSSRLNLEHTFAWWQSGSTSDYEADEIHFSMGLTFANDQYVAVATKGMIGMHQPKVRWEPADYNQGVVYGYKDGFGVLSVGIGMFYSSNEAEREAGRCAWGASSDILKSANAITYPTFSMIQLIKRASKAETWTDWHLDNAVPYNAQSPYNYPIGTPPGSSYKAAITDSDAPNNYIAPGVGIPFASTYMTDQFEQYFVFRPSTTGSIWVTLGKAQWNWHGAIESDSSPQGWRWIDSPVFYHSQTITPSTQIPEWINVKHNL
jgi:hypothetical protein